MSNTKTEVDVMKEVLRKTLDGYSLEELIVIDGKVYTAILDAMQKHAKQRVKAALPIILQHVSEKTILKEDIGGFPDSWGNLPEIIDKSSILSLENDVELNKLLGIWK